MEIVQRYTLNTHYLMFSWCISPPRPFDKLCTRSPEKCPAKKVTIQHSTLAPRRLWRACTVPAACKQHSLWPIPASAPLHATRHPESDLNGIAGLVGQSTQGSAREGVVLTLKISVTEAAGEYNPITIVLHAAWTPLDM